MATFLSVDIDILGKTARSLRAAESTLNTAMKAMGAHGDIGTRTLNDAAETFQRRWKYGIERIGESAGFTAEGVGKCHDAYVEVDSAFGKALEAARNALPEGAARP
ncbi:hypothetical protein D5S18_23985 [Nocardia panacis]|uniref:Uncharacterized protein n=1 Tax=Nocardia panacis TaxID=2340916 RepID=A0A3A4KDT9_9NOCA|nr:hypothetical protein [Nocardia panacis]RJO72222.1 hypothetical protein D5S18_23985 [Nocardia panacis]